MAGVTRIRLVDIPPAARSGSHTDEINAVMGHIRVGIGPHEALELPSEYDAVGGGQYLAGLIRKELVRQKVDSVDVLVRKNAAGKVKVYVVGR